MGSFVAALGLFVVARGLLSSCGLQAPGRVGSVVVVHGLSCPTACWILVPWPGIEPVSPELAGGFLTTAPPGKSCMQTLSCGRRLVAACMWDLVP